MTLIRDIMNFLLPRQCIICGTTLTGHEHSLCGNCLLRLPRTDCHLVEHNYMERLFWSRIPIERAAAFFHHDGIKVRSILYNLKYYSRPDVAFDMARIYAEELDESDFFAGIDCIVPVPLHWRRRLKRRYNQSDYIAKGLSKHTGIPVLTNVVKRVVNNPSQTKMNSIDRKQNVERIFCLTQPEKIRGKHVLLVDDVITTGSTLISCAQELAKAGDVRISVLTLAIASRSQVPTSESDQPDASVFGLPLME